MGSFPHSVLYSPCLALYIRILIAKIITVNTSISKTFWKEWTRIIIGRCWISFTTYQASTWAISLRRNMQTKLLEYINAFLDILCRLLSSFGWLFWLYYMLLYRKRMKPLYMQQPHGRYTFQALVKEDIFFGTLVYLVASFFFILQFRWLGLVFLASYELLSVFLFFLGGRD